MISCYITWYYIICYVILLNNECPAEVTLRKLFSLFDRKRFFSDYRNHCSSQTNVCPKFGWCLPLKQMPAYYNIVRVCLVNLSLHACSPMPIIWPPSVSRSAFACEVCPFIQWPITDSEGDDHKLQTWSHFDTKMGCRSYPRKWSHKCTQKCINRQVHIPVPKMESKMKPEHSDRV